MAEKSESNLESSSSLDDEDDFILLEEETKIRDNVEVLPVGRSSMTQKFHSAYGRPTLKRLRTSSFFDPFVGFGEAPSHRLSDPYNEIEFDISPGLMTSFTPTNLLKQAKSKGVNLFNKGKRTVHRKVHSAPFKKLSDKITFVLGAAFLALLFFTIGSSPLVLYPYLYTVLGAILLIYRVIDYFLIQEHYFLIDFCYFSSGIVQYYIWAYPNEGVFFLLFFGFCSGPMGWAIPTFRNSLVLHDIDRLTSVFLHGCPALLCYLLRWSNTKESPFFDDYDNLLSSPSQIFRYYLFNITFYLLWAAFYSTITYGLCGERIVQKKRLTLGALLEKTVPASKGVMWFFGEKYHNFMFMMLHMSYFLITLTGGLLCYYSRWMHFGQLTLQLVWSAWNGANFYMEYFSCHYEAKLNVLQRQLSKELKDEQG